MKLFLIGLLLASSFSPAVRAEDLLVTGGGREHSRAPKRVWVRRATLVAGCAASLVFDTLSTRHAIAAGAIEENGLLSSSQGRPEWGRVIGLKAGLCGATAVMEETDTFHAWKSPSADWSWIGVNSAVTGAYVWTGFHNLKLASDLSGH